MDKKANLRISVFSNPAVQGRILLVFFALTALLLATSWVVTLRALSAFGRAAMDLAAAQGIQQDLQLLREQHRAVIVLQMSVYTVLVLALVILGAVLLSHRIGGPLYRLAAYCRGVVRGEIKPHEVRFRKNDIPNDVAAAFNEFQRHHGIIPPSDDRDASGEETHPG